MRVTSKGQITIPKEIRDEFGILPECEVEVVVVEGDIRVRKVKGKHSRGQSIVDHLRGRATSGLTTDEIMRLTRGEDWATPS